ncbi:protein-export chaperone SecB [Streptococcus sp. 27098_8_75]|jgi:preprotein translocase subunit secB|uniref:protein-export chaperone SecB n=1 Tax=Streptococcus TaxID=1301 RepID=UPI00077914A2|nr:protein-export chaperone SecB [Streptococcus gordonii]MCB6584152.1 protein-export chaperone SecB [Streptococcus gordonii]MCB7053254.1 protein-export chaperone SecB [Streptococcus gordonii]MCB7055414.1 protein-export chaperone SecB [Streptococcus gordonii]MCC3175264.1 pretranslocase subunit SecB family protein [Streptococcus gordonii]MCG4842202.1 protein-export chaperone SecB [Streptococcus gordonii]
MAIISFEEYVIDKSVYQNNPEFENNREDGKLLVPIRFSAEIGIDKEEEKSYVIINVNLGQSTDPEEIPNIPFICEVSIRGLYSYSSSDFENEEELKQVLGSNAVAILYPYVRAYISTLTNLSNQFPAYTLPVMNFAETIKENDLITYIGFD